MPIHDIQTSFAGGEAAPELYGRTDIAKYKTMCKTLKNFIASPKGPAYNRPGTHFISAAKYNDRASRLIPFVFSTDAAYMLEFGDDYIRFYKNGGQILEDEDNSVIPFWDTNATYSLNQYVLYTKSDFTIHLYKSLKYSNIAQAPETATTYWQDIGQVRQWNSGTTYSNGDYVYEIRSSDGKRKLFISQQNSNLNNDPILALTYWLQTSPAEYSASTTYNIGDYISATDQFGNVSIYRSMRNSNTGHDYLTEALWWQFWNGPLTWGSGTTYVTGDFVIVLDGGGIYRCYQSLQDSNLNHNPLTASTIYWEAFDSPAAYEIESPYAPEDLSLLKFVQSADTLYIAHPNYIPQVLTRTSDNDWSLDDYDYVNAEGPFRQPNTDINKFLEVYLDGSEYKLITAGSPAYDYFTPDMVGAIFQLNYQVEANRVTGSFSGVGQSTSISCGGTWRVLTGGDWDGTIILEKSTDDGATWVAEATFYNPGATDGNVNTFGTIDNDGEPFLLRLNCTSLTNVSNSYMLATDAFTQTAIVKMTGYTDARHATCEIIKNVILNAQTFDWAEGAWSDYRGWPETVMFSQDRLIFGGNTSEPQTLWMTKSSNYTNFGRSSPLVDSDGITVNLLSRQINRIRSLVSFLNSLLSFTGSSEFSVGASNDGVLTPTTVSTKLQGIRGTNDVDPVMIGNHVIFVEPQGSAIRDMTFDLLSDAFSTENISILSSHLFEDVEIVAMAYQQEPDSVLWAVRDDGVMLSLTYMKEQEVMAWTQHETDGDVESIATIPGTDGTELWMIVHRDSYRFVERMLKRTTSTDPADQYFVDCGVTYSGAAASTFSGLDHLNGKTVAINAGGFVLPQQAVSNGQVTLDEARTKAVVGLPYTATLQQLPVEIPSPYKDGAFQGRRYHIGRAIVRFLNTVGGWIGMDPDGDMDEIDMRDEDLADATPTPLFSDYISPPIPQSDDSRGSVVIQQRDPMPMTILSIMPLIDSGKNP